jgi:hypothetical protein
VERTASASPPRGNRHNRGGSLYRPYDASTTR